jgi:hypothetical protein
MKWNYFLSLFPCHSGKRASRRAYPGSSYPALSKGVGRQEGLPCDGVLHTARLLPRYFSVLRMHHGSRVAQSADCLHGMTQKIIPQGFQKLLLLIAALFPIAAFATLSGVDDFDPVLNGEQQKVFNDAVMTYYQAPSLHKVDTVLDMLNDTDLLRKKTAWAPVIGFLTVIFADNKDHVFNWISRRDYNSYAQEVIVSSLLHAKLKESALVFAQAQQWSQEDIERIRASHDDIDLKKFDIILPGHIDTLWGAFFASGDPVYVNEIIDVLFRNFLPASKTVVAPVGQYDVVGENKKLAESTLKQYAHQQEAVRNIIKSRIAREKNPANKAKLKQLLSQDS